MKYSLKLFDSDGILHNHLISVKDKNVKARYCSNICEMIRNMDKNSLGIVTNNGAVEGQLKEHCLEDCFDSEMIFESRATSEKLAEELAGKNDYSILDEFEHKRNLKELYMKDTYMYSTFLESKVTKKPNPYMINKAIEKKGISPSKVVMIGDSRADIEAANAAQVDSVYLRGLENETSEKETLALNPTYVVDVKDSSGLAKILFEKEEDLVKVSVIEKR